MWSWTNAAIRSVHLVIGKRVFRPLDSCMHSYHPSLSRYSVTVFPWMRRFRLFTPRCWYLFLFRVPSNPSSWYISTFLFSRPFFLFFRQRRTPRIPVTTRVVTVATSLQISTNWQDTHPHSRFNHSTMRKIKRSLLQLGDPSWSLST